MATDPRCPHCGEKVSATARWCMHCSRDFDEPTDANGGFETVADGDLDELLDVIEGRDEGLTGLAVAVGFATWFILLVTSTLTSGITFLAAAGFAYYLAQKHEAADVLIDGAYGAAALVVGAHLFEVAMFGPAFGVTTLIRFFDPAVVVFVAALVYAGHRLKKATRRY